MPPIELGLYHMNSQGTGSRTWEDIERELSGRIESPRSYPPRIEVTGGGVGFGIAEVVPCSTFEDASTSVMSRGAAASIIERVLEEFES